MLGNQRCRPAEGRGDPSLIGEFSAESGTEMTAGGARVLREDLFAGRVGQLGLLRPMGLLGEEKPVAIQAERLNSAFRIPHSAFRIPHSAFRILTQFPRPLFHARRSTGSRGLGNGT